MKKYICIGKWKVVGTCGFDRWTVLDWTDDYTEARIARQEAELKEEAPYNHYSIEEKITILEPLK